MGGRLRPAVTIKPTQTLTAAVVHTHAAAGSARIAHLWQQEAVRCVSCRERPVPLAYLGTVAIWRLARARCIPMATSFKIATR